MDERIVWVIAVTATGGVKGSLWDFVLWPGTSRVMMV